ncbi:hypothetical protein [Psychrobacter pygoscelis]|uniref:hypothetical protein n=1 Tax=Psychrobacter pygoscelis TaxID=2488563 RepID=UPI00103EE9E6|nr:hypothetical protein [Psychrobacter pygoscelis]
MSNFNLTELANDLKAQERPGQTPYLWCVYEIDLHPCDPDRTGHYEYEYAWYDNSDPVLYEDGNEMYEALNVVSQGEWTVTIDGNEYEKLCLSRIPKIVTACFTRQAALNYIEANRHNLKRPFVDCISLNRNPEMLGIRDFFKNTF